MKKTLGLVALFVIIISSCFYFFVRQPKNIFDKIYQRRQKIIWAIIISMN